MIENDFLQTGVDATNNRGVNKDLVKKSFRQKRNCSLPHFENRRFNFFAKTSRSCDQCGGDDETAAAEEKESVRMLSSPDSTGEHHHSIINKSSNSTYDSIHEYENVVSKNNSFLVNQNTIEDLSNHHRFAFMVSKQQDEPNPSLKDASNTSLALRSLKRVLGSRVSRAFLNI